MAQGLARKVRLAFITQALIGSVLISGGILLAGVLVRDAVLTDRMQREADDFWTGHRLDPSHPLPLTSSVTGYLDLPGAPSADLPPQLRTLDPGLHAFSEQARMVYIDEDERSDGRFYVTFTSALVDRAILYTGLVSLLLSLLATYLTTWRTYRLSQRLVAPVSWLANVVRQWDPRDPDVSTIAPANLPGDSGFEVQRLARSLSGLADRVADFVQRERDFTRDASHELRTPLTVIRVATDLMLADSELTARAQRSLSRIQRAGRDMEAVIDAFLILAREADMSTQNEEFEVRSVVDEEIERVRPLLVGKPVELTLVDEGGPQLNAPPHVLNVMLGNLLTNAARFTDRGRIEVRIEARRIEVRDSGIGMTPEALAKVFNPFYRVDITREDAKGMGLSIVRRLGDRFGWPVTLESVAGEGTVATIRFDG
ncbi:sensor histidine kinase [Lysobacter sp. D1-1-M9]|uniref:sensor histidine kinase n=1 Tax=Novilysobacter longmucuonensis TaxID=3098603 RepID=UPI002FC79C69